MPTNLLKKYPSLLELAHLSEYERTKSLKGVFNRDLDNDKALIFQTKTISPIKGEEPSMLILFKHLTTSEIEETENNGKKVKRRIFEMDRSVRLHWIYPHIKETIKENIKIFSTEERIRGRYVNRTYIYNTKAKYVIVLEPQRSKRDYYLLSAYYLNRTYGEKMIKKKLKNCLTELL